MYYQLLCGHLRKTKVRDLPAPDSPGDRLFFYVGHEISESRLNDRRSECYEFCIFAISKFRNTCGFLKDQLHEYELPFVQQQGHGYEDYRVVL